MQVKELDGVKVTKNEIGIYFNDELKLIKQYALYVIMFKDKLHSKKEAEKIWDKLTAMQILIKYFGKETNE